MSYEKKIPVKELEAMGFVKGAEIRVKDEFSHDLPWSGNHGLTLKQIVETREATYIEFFDSVNDLCDRYWYKMELVKSPIEREATEL